MAKTTDTPSLWNPMAFLTDLGMRALDMTMSSSQSISEGVDRFARAGASVEAAESAAADSAVRQSASAASSGVALAADLQRSTFDLMTRAWLQWMSALGSLASLGAGMAGEGLGRNNLPLDAMRRSLAGWAGMPGTPARSGGAHDGSARRAARAEIGPMEHAHASAEPKRRRGSTGTSRSRSSAKPRRSRST